MSETAAPQKFKVNDRVKRADGVGGFGVVKEIRYEIISNATEAAKEKTAMINVFWDNGTLSYHGASMLAIAK